MRNPHARIFHAFLFGTLATSLVAIGALITTAATAPRAHADGVDNAQTTTLGVPLVSVGPACSGDSYAVRRWWLRSNRKRSSGRCD